MYRVKKESKGLVMNNSGPCPNFLYLPETISLTPKVSFGIYLNVSK